MSKQTQLGENQCNLLLIKTCLYSEKQEQTLEQILSTSHTQLHYSMPDSSLIPCPTGSWGTVELWLFHNSFSLLLFLLSLLQHGFCPQTAVFQDKPVPVWSLQGLQGNLCSSPRNNPLSSLPSLPSLFPHLGFCRAVSHIFSSHLSLLHGFLKYLSPYVHHSGWGAQMSSELCPFWSQLKPGLHRGDPAAPGHLHPIHWKWHF